ncbi:hypothetical protein B9Z55_010017 [Caenorhabditis nigoni]|uniref:Uncharacterized protein n=1 Tax=Caenorhabditis nigoni TaxID=1611254 RepID=A0A2G5UE23_9PELO|nr:hypothetical protein B9Z55_010017 [Caenorhabditis nigoni]
MEIIELKVQISVLRDPTKIRTHSNNFGNKKNTSIRFSNHLLTSHNNAHFWFLWENIHIVFFFLLPYSLVQCKRKKKFSGDSRVQLVDTKTPKNPTSKKDARRPQSQVAPQQTPVEMSKVTDDTLA